MKRALVIRTIGDAGFAGAIVNGLMAHVTPTHSDSARRVAMSRHTPEEWAELTAQAQEYYGNDKRPCWLYRALLGLWGGLWLAVHDWYVFLRDWNREG